MDATPISVVFALAVISVVVAIEVGYRLGHTAHRRSGDEKESPVSAISGTILGLLAFILAFTFAIVSDRYDARKGLVRDEANAIRTVYARSEFLPQPDRSEAKALLKQYVGIRIAAVQARALDQMATVIADSDRIQRRLWDMAVVNARKDMNSDVAALYVEALNEMTNLHALRVAIGLQARIPTAIWVVLCALIALAMISVGYQTAIAASRRTWAMFILALSFSLVVTLIAELDRPQSRYVSVTQQPLADLQAWMASDVEGR
jgi:Protein of unknown function (DUF4239)